MRLNLLSNLNLGLERHVVFLCLVKGIQSSLMLTRNVSGCLRMLTEQRADLRMQAHVALSL